MLKVVLDLAVYKWYDGYDGVTQVRLLQTLTLLTTTNSVCQGDSLARCISIIQHLSHTCIQPNHSQMSGYLLQTSILQGWHGETLAICLLYQTLCSI